MNHPHGQDPGPWQPAPAVSSAAAPIKRWLPARVATSLHGATRLLVVGALLSGAVLLGVDVLPRLVPQHALISAVPLFCIGLAYISLQPLVRPQPLELVKRLLLGTAFILWGIDQLLPPGWLATVIQDVVILLYVGDLALIIRGHLREDNWNCP